MTRYVRGALLVGAACVAMGLLTGCRNHMPHAFTWSAGGDVVPSHAKPPEGGYYSNWDPFAVELEVTPMDDVNPVQTQHVLIATVKDKDGKPLPNRRVEWMINEGSVGDIVEVDESGWRASRGYKLGNDYAVSHTNNFKHVLTRGNDDPSDDIELTEGQTWCVITSPIEGETHVTAWAPGIYNWDKHKVFVTKKWYDVDWEFPPPASNPVGTSHDFVTKVTKHSDGSPLVGYDVTYTIVDGPAGTLSPSGGSSTTVKTDGAGEARVTLTQSAPAEGTNNLKIDIMRPANEACCEPPVFIATGMTAKTWLAPQITIQKDCPSVATIHDNFNYTITVSNPSQVATHNTTVTDNLPDGIEYVSSTPASSGGSNLSWSLGTLEGGQSATITVTVKGNRTGDFNNCASVSTSDNLSAEDCCETKITAPALTIEKQCPSEVTICDTITHTIVVRNTGDSAATNVRVTDELPDGMATPNGETRLVFDGGTLNPGEAKQASFQVQAKRTGTFTNRASVTGDGGLAAEASCTTTVRQPALVITKTGPSERFIGRAAEYEITVTNSGDAAANNTVLTDQLPGNVEFISASDGGAVSGRSVSWSLGTLAPGASKTVKLNVRPTSAGESRNTASARATCAEAEAAHVMNVQGVPAVLLEVIDIEDPIEVGQNEVYEITVTNQGTAMDTNIRIVTTCPSEQQPLSGDGATPGTVSGQTVTFDALPSLAPKAKAVWRVTVKGTGVGDVRFKVSMTTDQATVPVEETEATRIY